MLLAILIRLLRNFKKYSEQTVSKILSLIKNPLTGHNIIFLAGVLQRRGKTTTTKKDAFRLVKEGFP